MYKLTGNLHAWDFFFWLEQVHSELLVITKCHVSGWFLFWTLPSSCLGIQMIEHWPRAGDHARVVTGIKMESNNQWADQGIKTNFEWLKSRDQQSFSDAKEVWLLFCPLNLCKSRTLEGNYQAINYDFKSLDPSRQFSMSDMQVTNPCHGFVSTQQGLLLLTWTTP